MKKKFFVLSVGLFVSLLCISCEKKDPEQIIEITQNENVKKTHHKWFYFTNTGYEQIDKIQDVPQILFEPWTEAKRISSANSVSNIAFGIVNRLGVICFENEHFFLSKDENLFSNRTAGNIVFLNETPIFSLYKSSFFNDSISSQNIDNTKDNHLFLIQFDNEAKISYPLINCENICSEPNSEITDFVWDGLNWICSAKSISPTKTTFTYLSFAPTVSLITLSPATANGNLSIQPSSVEQFREAKKQLDYSLAPERVKNILSSFSTAIPFRIEVKTCGGNSPKEYVNLPNEQHPLKATAILAESWSAALFEDGTLFIEGALEGKHILRNGKPVAIRLPLLPENFVYSDFVITGTSLYAAWEETSFYKTGRSGFLYVDLENTLYSSNIKF